MSTRPQLGFSLIEMMVTAAVMAIVVAVAIPVFTAVVNGNRLSAAANETMAALQGARMEAIKSNRRTVACLSTNPGAATPTCSAANPVGWIVFVDADRDGQYDAAERLVRTTTLPQDVRLLGSVSLAGALTFRADGMARNNVGDLVDATVAVCIPTAEPQENVRQVSVGDGSRLSIRKANGGGACNTPPDDPDAQ